MAYKTFWQLERGPNIYKIHLLLIFSILFNNISSLIFPPWESRFEIEGHFHDIMSSHNG